RPHGAELQGGPWTGSWTGSPDAPSATRAIDAMACAIVAASGPQAREHASRNAPLVGFRPAVALRCGRVLARRGCQSSLGYEPYDVCLYRLAQSPVTGLTSMDWGREVAFGRLRIARLKPSFIPSSVARPHESRSGREPGPADRARRRAVVIPGSPPGRRPETLVGEEFVHGA